MYILKRLVSVLIIILLSLSFTFGQKQRVQVKDIFNPGLYGQVKTLKEYIINQKDTLRKLIISYSSDGIRTSQHTISRIPGTPFVNKSICWRRSKDTLIARDCMNDSFQNSKINLNKDGTTLEMDVTSPGLTISYIPEYNANRLMKTLNTAKSEKGSFQFFATASYEYNKDGKLIKTNVEGGDQPQGITIYTYDGSGRLTKSVRTEKDGATIFEIDYIGQDDHGNWQRAIYQNGLKIYREFEYY